MKKRFYLIRHGIKVKHAGNPPLSEVGKMQAQATADYLKKFPIDEIVSSPILRSNQTAEYISKALDIPLVVNRLLRERVNWGDDSKQTFEEFLTMWEKATTERDWLPPVGDSSRTSGKRLQEVIEKHKKNHSQIALVTHGGIITDFLFNVFDDNILNKISSGFSESKENSILEGSVTIVDYDLTNKVYDLISIALTEHLDKI
ncbi:MAG: histidine phosphatase family protein [Candidatus Levybacteria bacterium]|nr:histidine phosphatase family protein [Candidatus Levybacteria bacterium]